MLSFIPVTVHRGGVPIVTGCGRLGPAEVFDAEAKGALEGLRAALGTCDAPGSPIVVCLDNLAAATCLQGAPSDSSQDAFLEFQALAASHGATEVRWIPGHTKIPGNDEADALAKAACSLPEPGDALPTLAHLRRTAKRLPKDAFKSWWEAAAPDRYKALDLDCLTRCPKEFSLPRPTLHHLLAARTHHGDFADYHERFNHDDARMNCSCGRRKAPHHLFHCRKVSSRHRMRLAPSPTAIIHRAIGRDFDKFVKNGRGKCFLRSHLSSSLDEDTLSYSFNLLSPHSPYFPYLSFPSSWSDRLKGASPPSTGRATLGRDRTRPLTKKGVIPLLSTFEMAAKLSRLHIR